MRGRDDSGVVCGGVRGCAVVWSGVRWCAVVCGGLRWFAAVCGGVEWSAAVCGGVRWFVGMRARADVCVFVQAVGLLRVHTHGCRLFVQMYPPPQMTHVSSSSRDTLVESVVCRVCVLACVRVCACVRV